MPVDEDSKELDRLLEITAISKEEHESLKGWLRRGASSAQLEAIKLIAD